MDRKRIAVVEDNEDNRLLLHAFLDEQYELQDYKTGPEALRDMDAAIPELVLLDISLPGMDGVEMLSRLRRGKELRRMYVIALAPRSLDAAGVEARVERLEEYLDGIEVVYA